MKAVVLTELEKLELKERSIPEIMADEVLVKVKITGICGTDVHVMKGHHPAARTPLVMGHEFSGVVEKIGNDVSGVLAPGDRVVVQPYEACGECESCKSGYENACKNVKILGVHCDGGFQEYINVKASRVFRIDDEIDFELAALIEPLGIAVHDVRRSGLKVGGSVSIIGGGPIGLLLGIVARLNGASKVVINEINPERIAKAKELGFTVIDPLNEDVASASMKLTGDCGFDVVFEVSGSRAGAEMMTEIIKIRGTIVIVGIPPERHRVDTDSVFKKEINIVGVRLHSKNDFQAAIDIIKSVDNRKIISELISGVYPVEKINDAFDQVLRGGDSYKVLVKMQ